MVLQRGSVLKGVEPRCMIASWGQGVTMGVQRKETIPRGAPLSRMLARGE